MPYDPMPRILTEEEWPSPVMPDQYDLYWRRELILFGRRAVVYTLYGLNDLEINDLLWDAMLSDQGKEACR